MFARVIVLTISLEKGQGKLKRPPVLTPHHLRQELFRLPSISIPMSTQWERPRLHGCWRKRGPGCRPRISRG